MTFLKSVRQSFLRVSHWGFDSRAEEIAKRHIVMINSYCIISIIVTIISSFAFREATSIISGAISIGTVVGEVFVLFLHKKNRLIAAKVTFFAVNFMAILMVSSFLPRETHIHYYFLCLSQLTFVLFRQEQLFLVMAASLSSVGAFFIFDTFGARLHSSWYTVDSRVNLLMRPFNNALALSLFILFNWVVSWVNQHVNRELRIKDLVLSQQSRMSALGEMASGIAHEINNPLAVMVAKAGQLKEYLTDGPVDVQKFSDELGKIETTGFRISKIIKGLSQFSRNSESDPMEMMPLQQIFDDTLELCKEKIKNSGIDLRVRIEGPTLILCRPSQISQVLLNLLNNGIDALEGHDSKWIELAVTEGANGETLMITVTDGGLGIPPAVADKIMQPFFSTKEVGKGTGLGLSISKGIVEAHGGKFYYDPSAKHTRFVIELPTRRSRGK